MPDVNILIYAHRQDERVHRLYRDWLEQAMNHSSPLALSALVTVGFVRIVTNPKIYRNPTPISVAVAVIETLVNHTNCRLIYPGQQHWPLVAKLCRASQARGKLVADAQQAAIAIEHGCEWMTRDSDFERFASCGLRWQHLNFS